MSTSINFSKSEEKWDNGIKSGWVTLLWIYTATEQLTSGYTHKTQNIPTTLSSYNDQSTANIKVRRPRQALNV